MSWQCINQNIFDASNQGKMRISGTVTQTSCSLTIIENPNVSVRALQLGWAAENENHSFFDRKLAEQEFARKLIRHTMILTMFPKYKVIGI